VAADAAIYSARNETAAKPMGVKRVCIPNRATKSLERKREQMKRWFRHGRKWRTDARGASAWSSGDMGLDRCRTRPRSECSVALGVISDNLNIGRMMSRRAAP
jgi:IS5 family transposase